MNHLGMYRAAGLLLLATGWLYAATLQGAANPEAPASTPIELPQVEIAAPVGYDSAEALEKWSEAEVDRLVAEAGKAGDAATRAQNLLAAANQLLAYGLVRDATGVVLGLNPAEQPAQGSIAAHDRVKAILSQAQEALGTNDGQDPTLARLAAKARTLQAFATGLRAALTAEGEAEEARRAAASALAPLSEDLDEGVAAAAGLWQAVLRSRESELAPAMSILPMALSDPRPGREVYEFFGKLLRCRLLGRGSPSAALTLSLQVEEHAHHWFEGAGERSLAVRTAAWVRFSVLRDWCAKPQAADKTSEWCRQTADDIRTQHFANGSALLPLAPTIPILKDSDQAADSDKQEPEKPADNETP